MAPPRWEAPPTQPTPDAPDNPLRIPPYYLAWEQEQARRRNDLNRLGLGVLQDISRPKPSADVGDLARAVRSWQVVTRARS